MSLLRRGVQVVALAGTLLIGIIAVALIVSQTPWFKDWLRRYVMRQSSQYLNGELTIGGLGGNLFFGVDLRDVAVDMQGERVVAVRDIEVDYSVIDFISRGLVIDDIRITEPRVVLSRREDGRWNLGALVKRQEREAAREGPGRTIAVGSIGISQGQVRIEPATGEGEGPVGTAGAADRAPLVRLPDRIRRLDAQLSFRYEPVRFTVAVDHLSFETDDPDLRLERVQGTLSVRGDDLHFDELKIHTADSALHVDGAIERYATSPVFRIEAASERLSLPEIARFVPAAGRFPLHPSFEVSASGPLAAMKLHAGVRSEAGEIEADAVADLEGPRRAVRGEVALGAFNLAPLLNDPAQRSHITGRAEVDLTLPASGIAAARGSWAFSGPRVQAAGYEARDVTARGELRDARLTVDGRARAYGAAATARGSVELPLEGRALAFALDGRATGVNLQALPASLGAPRLQSDLNTTYHVEGAGGRLEGRAELERSAVEGATIAEGTVASFSTAGAGRVSYAARGEVAGLDLRRLGRGLRLEALSGERFDSRINARFDVKGSGTSLETMTLDASGALRGSRLFGGSVPRLEFETRLSGGALHARARGELAGFDPAALSGRSELAGELRGAVDVEARVPGVAGPVRLEAVEGTARITLGPSAVGGIDVERGAIDAALAGGTAQVRELRIEGPDLEVKAAGRAALTAEGTSDLTFHVASPSLQDVGRLTGQPLSGSAIVDGRLTGPRSALRAAGTLDGSDLRYGANGALDVNTTYDVIVPDLRVARARVSADTHATFLTLGGTEIQELKARTTYAERTVGFDAAVTDRGRELHARGEALLHPDHSEVHLPALALRAQGIEWRMAGPDAVVRYGAERLSFENVELRNGSQALAVAGAISRSGEAPSGRIDVRASNVDLRQLQQLLLVDRGLGGTLDADAELTGTLASPRVEGEVRIANGAFRDFQFESLGARLLYTPAGVRVDARLQQTPQQWLTAKGFVPAALFRSGAGGAGEPVDLRVESSEIALGFIQGFTTQVADVRGTIRADVRVSGTAADPHAEGTIAIRSGAFALPATGTSYSGLDTTLELRKDRLVVPGFQISDENGNPLLVSGEVAIRQREVGDLNLTLQSENFEAIDNELADIGIGVRLTVGGELRQPRLTGSVEIADGRVEVDRVLAMASSPYRTEAVEPAIERGAEAADDPRGATAAAGSALRGQPSAPAPAAAPEASAAPGAPAQAGTLFERLAADVTVRIPNNLVLRGQDLRPGGPGGLAIGNVNVTVGGNVRVTKRPYDVPRLVGTVNTVRGFYEFQGRRFELQREGTIRFVGLETINPTLDIVATREIAGVEARVRVVGTAREPALELSSRPPQDQADILSLIVFNRSVNDLSEGERVSLAQRAGAIASGFVAAPLAESIGEALDVDLFEIEPTQVGGEMGAGITLGQQIGENLFLTFHQEFGPRDASEFIVEYQLADFLRLRASAAPGGGTRASRVALKRIERAGADLLFFFSY